MNHSNYTVGWICALEEVELPAATAMLDEEHSPLPRHQQESNLYTLGTIEGHNVAIACLPAGRYGTNAAAVAAQNMLRTFPSIRFGLMVGIGGGVPSPSHDIRLGNVVVSQPTNTNGGVVQYDLGKSLVNEDFVIKGHLDAPPAVLLNGIALLKGRHKRRDPEVGKYIRCMLEENPKMTAEFG